MASKATDGGAGISPEQYRRWVETAEALKPTLHSTVREPVALVAPVADDAAFLHWKMERTEPVKALAERLLTQGDEFYLDFGSHGAGYFSFRVAAVGTGVDAPVRVRITFGEVPVEVALPHDPYKGSLSRAWLQDETVTLDVLPATVHLPRRYAFRYAKVEVLAISSSYKICLDEFRATAVTSAEGTPEPLRDGPGISDTLRKIDEVSIHTLRDCMQTVFEDGPKRDRRLWIGDLRLQALANYATFRNYKLVKRCLYLFAGLPYEDGSLAACVFEQPQPVKGGSYIVDYAALYAAALLDYAKASGDWATARELWPVVRLQMELLGRHVNADGLFRAPKDQWVFIDWRDGLQRDAAMHAIFVYSLKQAAELAQRVGASAEAAQYAERITQMTAAARKAYFDATQSLFTSGPERQVSWATQAWMTLAGIATKEEGAKALLAMFDRHDAVRPGSPYLYHYFTEAMLECGLKNEALDLIEWYWGSMVKAGADTFWEVYDPQQPGLSPYGSVLMNSYCHAWSCTPAYLLRRGSEG